ncbi:MAG: hypothetical protein WBA68_00360 [Alteraurantiacibacter sp.]
MHAPPPRPLRTFAKKALVVMRAGGRYLLWLGPALALVAGALWFFEGSTGPEFRETVMLVVLFWAAILVVWHMVLTFLRWWIWWHSEG